MVASPPVAAQPRPKICLVLSGGGARGAAHIGVLKALEARHVPIDCIAGTSMGSLVGGAYASGMTIAAMEELIGEISVQALFNERPPRPDQSVRRKIDDRSILLGPEIGLSDKLDATLPKGVVSGVQLESVLRRVAQVQGYAEFDRLAIPFRAVATDLVTGKPVIIDRGELANVMRASMSIPGAIAPAEISGQLLVDGGLTDNLPIGVARAMGADIVIAVNLGTPLLRREEVTSLIGVTSQMVNILTEQNVRASLASLKPTDILIEPALGEFSAADFDHLAQTVPIGVAAVERVADRLATLSMPPDAYAAWSTRRTTVTALDMRAVDEIRFVPMQRVNPDAALAMMESKPGAPLDPFALDRDMSRLYGTGDFEHVNYRVLEEAGKRVLLVDAVEKSWGPNYLRFGLGLGADFQGDAYFNAAASYRRTWMNALGAEWRTDAQVGRTSRLVSEFYQPMNERSTLFVAPRVDLERTNVDLFQGAQRIARYRVSHAQVGLDVGSEFARSMEVRVGVVAGTLHASLDTGPPALEPPGHVQQGAFRVQAIVDKLDSANFPRDGYAGSTHIFASTQALGADDTYTRWDADFLGVHSIGPHTLQAAIKAGGAIGDNRLPRYDLFSWGGFLQQSGYPTGALLGERLTFGRLVYSYRLREARLFEGVYVGASLEAGRVGAPLVPGSPTGTLTSIAAFFAADTPVGPFYVGYGWARDGNRSAYLYLGRP